MENRTSRQPELRRPRGRAASDQLDRRYGAIGISAVAAAARYPSDARAGPAPRRRRCAIDRRFERVGAV